MFKRKDVEIIESNAPLDYVTKTSIPKEVPKNLQYNLAVYIY